MMFADSKCLATLRAAGASLVACLAVLAAAPAWGWGDCGPGRFNDRNAGGTDTFTACRPCPAGTYQPDWSSSIYACYPCREGTYAPNTGTAQCTPASQGSFVPTAGATAQYPCPPGTYSNRQGSPACTQAPRGWFVAAPGATSATQCTPGTFADVMGLPACKKSPAGYHVPNPGSLSPTVCKAGTFSGQGQHYCANCPANTWSGQGASQCIACTGGTTTSGFAPATSPSACQCGGYPNNKLAPGQKLAANQVVISPNGQHKLAYQTDGNLVLYSGPNPAWASNFTSGFPGYASMETGGNFATYSSHGMKTWASGTVNNPGAWLQVQDNGILAIYKGSCVKLWSNK